ncbi:MAG: hypothetical protein P4L51_23765 [Puia sp.]|nr:hypothetical protein [Puia sp.]
MLITRISQLDGQEYTMDLNITLAELARIRAGQLVQTVVPHLPREEREFLISGITPDAWEKTFGGVDTEPPAHQ